MNLINPSLEIIYCSNLIFNYSIIRFIRFVSLFTDSSRNAFFISFRFKSPCGAEKKIGILNWNVRGLNNPARRKVVRDLVSETRTTIVTLQETKLDFIDAALVSEIRDIVL